MRGMATAALDKLGDGRELVARDGGGEVAGVEEEAEKGGLAWAAASDHECVSGGVLGWHPVWAGRAAGAAGVGELGVHVLAVEGVAVMVEVGAPMAVVDVVHERRRERTAEGIRCGCAGMGAFSNAYNHQRGAGADIAARSGPAIRTESSAPSSGQSPSESPFRPINRARFRPNALSSTFPVAGQLRSEHRPFSLQSTRSLFGIDSQRPPRHRARRAHSVPARVRTASQICQVFFQNIIRHVSDRGGARGM